MRPFLALLKVNFKSLLLTTFNMGRGKKKASSGIAAFIFVSILMLYLSGTYSFMLGSGLAALGGLDVMLMYMVLMSIIAPLFFLFFSVQSLVFSTKDLDLVLSLPVSTFAVMLSRIMALYLQVLLMTVALLIPAGVAYLVFGGAGGVVFFVILLLEGVLLSFITTTAGLILGGLVAVLISRLPLKNLFTVILSVAVTGLIMVLSFQLSTIVNRVVADVDGTRQSLLAALPPLGWIVNAATGPNFLSLLLVAVLSIVPFLLVTWLFSLFFKPLLSALSSHAMRKNFKLGQVRSQGAFKAVFKKEAGKFFGTPAYLLNYGMGIFLLIAGCVVALFNKNSIDGVLADMTGSGLVSIGTLLPLAVLGVIAFFQSTTVISSVSISLEGKTLWILKEAPLGTGRIFAAKAGFNFLLTGGLGILVGLLLGIALGMSPLDILCIIVVSILMGGFVSLAGLYINLRHPRMDAENDTIVIKQSASVIITMVCCWLMIGVGAALFALFDALALPLVAFYGACVLLLACANVLLVALLNTSGRRLFAAL